MPFYQNGKGIFQDRLESNRLFEVEEKYQEKYSPEDVREYLLGVVTGTTVPVYSEHGEMRVSFEKLKELVEEGYNIIRVLNPETLTAYNIHIEYQKYDNINNIKHGR